MDELNKYKNILKTFDFKDIDELVVFINKYKKHKCNNDIEQNVKEKIKELDIKKENKDYENSIKLLNEEIKDLKQKLDNKDKIINSLEIKNNINLPTPENSTESKNTSHNAMKYKNKFFDKNLHILERCNVLAYEYNEERNNKKHKGIIEFISSEYKFLVRFNSSIIEKIGEDNDIWEHIYEFKIKNGELKDTYSNKSNFKYKLLRCKELYDIYGENLSKFRIYVTYLGRLTQKEWKDFLIEFDKLYNNIINEEYKCKHTYKDGKKCDRINCNVKHKDIK
jgi:predicted RNase H-like nuclease (RuvC/YqgF family)